MSSLFPAAVILAAGIFFWLRRKAGRKGLFLFALVFFCLSGWQRMSLEMREVPLEHVLADCGTKMVEAEGRIIRAELKEGVYSLTLEPAVVTAEGKQYEEKRLMVTAEEGKVSLSRKREQAQENMQLEKGMYLWVKGKAELFQEARNPGEFDYRLYYRSQKLRCRVKANRADALPGSISVFRRQISMFRGFVNEALAFLCREEDRGILKAVLLGDKNEMDSEIRKLYQDGGIAHILAVSGLHVSLIGMSLYGFLRKRGIGYGASGIAAAALLFFYGALTGFGASVFRAVFMVFCSFLAAYLGRTYDLLSAMSLSLLLLVSDSPYLLFTSGLQLSYGAVAAVGFASELKNVREKENLWGTVYSAVYAGASIQIVTFPVILYHFFEFPLYGIILNLIVIPLMAYAAGSGIAAVGLYGIWKVMGMPAAPLLGRLCQSIIGPGHYILAFYRELCESFLILPFSRVITGRPPLWSVILYYGVLFYFYAGYVRGKKNGGFARTTACLAAILFLTVRPKVQGFEIYFLDVGQGDGIFYRTNRVNILTDCGSSQYKSIGKNRLVPFLKSQGIRRLDYIFISHGDSDHINGIIWILENEPDFSVGEIIMPRPGEGEEIYRRIEELGRRQGAEVSYMEAGEKIEEGDLNITALHPERTVSSRDKNGHSLVLSVEYRDFRMLLTGDVEREGEKRMLESEKTLLPRHVSVLKAAHHGSATSTGREFLEQVKPAITILSYGQGNSYGHPSLEVVGRLGEAGTIIRSTESSGAIHITTDGRRMKVKGFLLDRSNDKGYNTSRNALPETGDIKELIADADN